MVACLVDYLLIFTLFCLCLIIMGPKIFLKRCVFDRFKWHMKITIIYWFCTCFKYFILKFKSNILAPFCFHVPLHNLSLTC